MLITWKRLGCSLLFIPILACPANDEGGVTASDTSTSDSNPTTNNPTTSSTSSSSNTSTTTTSTTDSTTTVDPDTGTSTMTTSPSTTGAEDSTSTSTGGELCEIMLPPPRECPFPAPRSPGWAPPAAPGGGANIDDYAALPDEQAGGFIQEPDAGETLECDIWEQNCPEGEKCMPWANDGGGSWNATRCSPLDPNPNAVGDPCSVEGSGVSGIDDCDLGAMCWDVDPETNMGTCIELCSCSPEFPICNTPNSACSISNEGVLVLCLAACNPLDPDACPEGQACYGIADSFQCAPDVSGPMGAVGDECEFLNVCDPGTFCASASSVPGCDGGSAGCCSSFCTIGNDAACLDGQVCSPWFEEGQAPDECLGTVGACVLP